MHIFLSDNIGIRFEFFFKPIFFQNGILFYKIKPKYIQAANQLPLNLIINSVIFKEVQSNK